MEIQKVYSKTSNKQILGTTSTKDLIVYASYFDPGFYIDQINNKVPLESENIEFIGTHPTLSDKWGGKRVELWPDADQPRAQEGRISADLSEFWYIRNGQDTISVLPFEVKYDSSGKLENIAITDEPRQIEGFNDRIESFLPIGDDHIFTLENYANTQLILYERDDNRVKKIESFDLLDFAFGLAKYDDKLLFITDSRSKMKKGVYAFDISSGIEDIFKSQYGKVIGSEEISGNGIAVLEDGLVISKYTFNRKKVIGEPSTLTYCAFK